MAATDVRGYPPDMDLIMAEDRGTNGSIVRSLTIETRILFEGTPDGLETWEEIRAAIGDLGTDAGRRRAYELVYKHAKADLDRNGPAHAVVQATFGQVALNEAAVPKKTGAQSR